MYGRKEKPGDVNRESTDDSRRDSFRRSFIPKTCGLMVSLVDGNARNFYNAGFCDSVSSSVFRNATANARSRLGLLTTRFCNFRGIRRNARGDFARNNPCRNFPGVPPGREKLRHYMAIINFWPKCGNFGHNFEKLETVCWCCM